MKHLFSLLLILSLLALPAQAETPADPLLDQAIALACRLGELAASEGYVAAYSTSGAISEIVAAWASGNYGAPAAAQRVTLDAEATGALLAGLSGEGTLSGLSETAYGELSRRVLDSLPTMALGMAGTETIAAASIMTVRTAFVCDGCDAPALYMLSYASGAPVAVTFQPYQDGAVIAQACFLGSPQTDAGALSGILAVLSGLGVTSVEEVPLP